MTNDVAQPIGRRFLALHTSLRCIGTEKYS